MGSKGGRKPRVTDKDILDVFRESRDPVLSTKEVAEEIPIKRRGTLNRLQSLEEEDVLESKPIGGRNTVWWLATQTPRGGSDRPESVSFEDISFPQGKGREECLEAIEAAYTYIKENGPASMREIVQEVMPNHSLGYEIPKLEEGERYRGSWWRKVIKPGLEAHPNIEKPPTGGSKWRYIG